MYVSLYDLIYLYTFLLHSLSPTYIQTTIYLTTYLSNQATKVPHLLYMHPIKSDILNWPKPSTLVIISCNHQLQEPWPSLYYLTLSLLDCLKLHLCYFTLSIMPDDFTRQGRSWVHL